MNQLLYGHNPKQRIVAVHQLNDRFIRLYTRNEGKVQHEDVEFFPFFFLSNPTLLDGFPAQFWLKELAGDLYYKYIAAFGRWGEMWEAVHFVLSAYNKTSPSKVSHYNELDSILLRPDPVHQFLMQSGNTLFKEMEFDELHRMQIDIQRAQRLPALGPKPSVERVARIVLSDTNGWYEVIDGEDAGQEEMMTSLVGIIRQRNPDILEGHNLFGFILPTLKLLGDQLSIDVSIGRDGSSLRHSTPRQSFRTGEAEGGLYEVAGRYLIDTQRLAEVFDHSARSFENLSLEYLARYFGIDTVATARSGLPSEQGDTGKKTRKTKEPYVENVKLVRRLSDILAPSNFYLAQMCPMSLDAIMRTGSAVKIESLLFRNYLRQKHSLPRSQEGSSSLGGYTDMFFTGVFSNIVHADVESLYPSIIISQNIRPRSDVLGTFVPILSQLVERRLEAKRAWRQGGTPQLTIRHDALQSALKVLINSFYGYLAYSRAHFNDFGQADHIATLGQKYLHAVIDQARLFNAQVLEVDTDGLFFVPPDNISGEDQEEKFVERLASSLPPGINLLRVGRYKKMLSYRRKNYALMDYEDKVLIRGSSLISRSLELFARRYIEKCIECLLREDFEELHRAYTAYHRRILAHQWSAREFCRSESVRDELETYEKELGSGSRSPSAAMEAAKRASLYPRPGMVVLYYVTGTEANVKISDNCRVAEEWDSNLPDENTAYYLSRLAECSSKFRDFFAPADFEKIFSTEDLFGFTPAGINLTNRELLPQKPDLQGEERDDEFPIWLDDQPS